MKEKTIYYFNPTCEMAVANGSPYYQPPALLREFEETLSSILLCYSSDGDYLLKNRPICQELVDNFQQLGCAKTEIGNKKEIFDSLKNSNQKVTFCPWGWSPSALNELKDFLPLCDTNIAKNPEHFKKYYERKNAVDVLAKIIKKEPSEFILQQAKLPTIILTLKDVEDSLQKWGQIILKAPLSSSGRGLEVIRKSNLNNSNIQWINTFIKNQGYLIAEPLLNKVVDLSFQYQVQSNRQIDFLGTSFFETNANGQYQGHFLNSHPEVHSFLKKNRIGNYLEELAQKIKVELSDMQFTENEGFLGVDALIYKEDSQYKIHPCVEINARNNMGILSLKLQQLIHPNSTGFYHVFNSTGMTYSDYDKSMKIENPPIFKDGKFWKGFLSLTDSGDSNRFGAYIILDGDK
ncbi:hypothetical protein ACUNWD_18205 [Sunxiuqinia sp. A32]|uniref:hypothetical protein n=1 Tax=Sunxiuqinia sp. A32 TaxID=3461496 RepID=UPI0040460B5C